MANPTTVLSEQSLMTEMGITAEKVERRRRFAGLTADDLDRIRGVQELIVKNKDALTSVFFDFLATIEEARTLFQDRVLLEEARRLKGEHLVAMVGGDYGLDYARQRIRLARIYGKLALDPAIFLGGFYQLLRAIGETIMASRPSGQVDGFKSFSSLQRVACFDVALIIEVLAFERERIIRQQQEAIRELSTPVLQVRDRLLILPIIGMIDTYRARLLTDGLLAAIRANRARVVIVDITGVPAVDSRVANHLLQSVAAARLMGARAIVTGLSSEVAQTLVTLGVDLSKLNTIGDLQGGIEEAERFLGYKVVARPVDAEHTAMGATNE